MNPPSSRPEYYSASARPPRPRPSAAGGIDCGLCIVGAGYAGLSAALHLGLRGHDTIVLEARDVGFGASGRNGGQLLSGYAPDMVELVKILGPGKARTLWTLAESAKAEALERATRLGVPTRPGWLAAATERRHLAGLEREAACWRKMGYDRARMVGPAEISGLVASPLYVGGLLDEGAAHLHPLDYARALAEAAEAAGARIFENSPALAIDAGLVRTPAATIRAKHVLVCGNADMRTLAPWLADRLAIVTTYVGVTPPLGEARAAALIPADVAVADSRFIPDYFRRTDDHRLVFGSGASYWRPLADPAPMLRRRLHQVFPQLRDIGFDGVWSGRIAATRDRLPLIGRLADGPWYACGFAGHGLAIAGLAGRLLAQAVDGDRADFDLFASLPHAPFPGGPLRVPLLALGMAWHRLRGLV